MQKRKLFSLKQTCLLEALRQQLDQTVLLVIHVYAYLKQALKFSNHPDTNYR
jgi:hypothetical protein